MSADEVLEIDHAAICPHCAIRSRKPQGLVFWDGRLALPIGLAWAIVVTGKWDVCRSFAFWCWDCGEKIVVPDGETYVCGCARHWFSEADQSEVVFIVATGYGEVPLDRRPLR